MVLHSADLYKEQSDEMEIHEISYPEADDPNVYRSVTETKKTKITLEGKIFGNHYEIYSMIAETLKGKPYIVTLDYARHLTEIMQSIHASADEEKLVVLRKLKGITQDEFACAVGVSRQAVYKWESGQSYPEVPKLLEMKLLFGISIDELLDDTYDIPLPEKKKRRRKRC